MKKCLLVAALTLSLMGCSRSTGDWIAQLQAKDSAERLHAVRALEDRRSDKEEVVAALKAALKDDATYNNAAEAMLALDLR